MKKGFLSGKKGGGIFKEDETKEKKEEKKERVIEAAKPEERVDSSIDDEELGRGTLRGIPGIVLGRLWPAESVLPGTIVSKWLRKKLTAHARSRSVIFRAVSKNVMDADDVVDSFELFPKSDLELQWQSQGVMSCSLLLNGLTRSISKGLCSNLTHLNLSQNSIGDDGAKLLAWLPRAGSKLSHLLLSHNDIGPEGAAHVAAVLNECKALQSIDLSSNRIDAPAATVLAKTLAKHRALASLRLDDNRIADAGASALAGSLRAGEGMAIACLSLQRNGIGESGILALLQAVGGANGLQRLELSGNALGEAERKRVQSSLVEEAEGEREALLAQWLAAL